MRRKLLIPWLIVIAGLFAFTSYRKLKMIEKDKRQESKLAKIDDKTPRIEKDPATGMEVRYDGLTEEQRKVILEDVANYQLNDEDILEKYSDQTEALRIFLLNNAAKKIACLKIDLCQEKPDPNDPYFDENNTPTHQLLERELTLLSQLEIDESSTSTFTSALTLPNEAIQTRSIEVLLKTPISDDGYNQVYVLLPALKPQPLATALVLLSKSSKTSQERREAFIQSITLSIKNDDQAFAVEIGKRLKYLDLDQNELETIANSTCGLLDHNKKQVHSEINIVAEGLGSEIRFNCQ